MRVCVEVFKFLVVGLLVHWFIGLLVYRFIGLSIVKLFSC